MIEVHPLHFHSFACMLTRVYTAHLCNRYCSFFFFFFFSIHTDHIYEELFFVRGMNTQNIYFIGVLNMLSIHRIDWFEIIRNEFIWRRKKEKQTIFPLTLSIIIKRNTARVSKLPSLFNIQLKLLYNEKRYIDCIYPTHIFFHIILEKSTVW